MNKHTALKRIALMATGAVLGGLGAHVYRRKRRTLRPYDPYRNRLPDDEKAWTPYHRRLDAREQLRADLGAEIRDGVNAALTRLTLGLYRPESMEPQSGHAAAVRPNNGTPTPLRVAPPTPPDE